MTIDHVASRQFHAVASFFGRWTAPSIGGGRRAPRLGALGRRAPRFWREPGGNDRIRLASAPLRCRPLSDRRTVFCRGRTVADGDQFLERRQLQQFVHVAQSCGGCDGWIRVSVGQMFIVTNIDLSISLRRHPRRLRGPAHDQRRDANRVWVFLSPFASSPGRHRQCRLGDKREDTRHHRNARNGVCARDRHAPRQSLDPRIRREPGAQDPRRPPASRDADSLRLRWPDRPGGKRSATYGLWADLERGRAEPRRGASRQSFCGPGGRGRFRNVRRPGLVDRADSRRLRGRRISCDGAALPAQSAVHADFRRRHLHDRRLLRQRPTDPGGDADANHAASARFSRYGPGVVVILVLALAGYEANRTSGAHKIGASL